jgi:hypothetical protein
MEEAEDSLGVDGGAGGALLSAVEPKLNAFTQAVERVIRSARAGSMGDYKVRSSTVCALNVAVVLTHMCSLCAFISLCVYLCAPVYLSSSFFPFFSSVATDSDHRRISATRWSRPAHPPPTEQRGSSRTGTGTAMTAEVHPPCQQQSPRSA